MIGESISHYRILEKLGEGGMGVVYKAEDTKLKRTVALKFLSGRAVAGDEERVRFQREAEAAAALSHPNICTVHEIDEFEGRPFIAMEFVDGQTLKQMIAAGPLKLDAALATALQVAEGLQEAHGAGIVHRDIKPANVMVAGEGRVKIMDFGLATSQAATRVTQKGTTIGTVAYMSPEQARGGEVDHRTDIWSFGAMLYEMVSGRLPFKGDSEQAVIYSIFNDEPQPLTGLRTGVPVDLERIAGKCLAKDPGERYQTATDLLADLRRLQRVSASGAPPPGPAVSRSGTEPRARHWSRGATLAAILVVIVALAPGILRRYFPTSGERSAAERAMLVVLPFDNLGAPEDEYFADGITEEITSRLATLHELGVISRTSAVTYKNTSKTIKQIGQELQVDYVLEGTVRWDRSGDGISRVRVTPQLIRVADDTHLWSERYDRELQNVFGIQSDVSEQVVQQLGIALLKPARLALQARPTENLAAYQAYLKGLDYSQQEMYSEENWRLVIQMFERAVELDPAFAVAYVELSEAHSEMVNLGFDRTPERVEMAKAAVDEALRLQPDLPDAHLALGYYYYWCLHEYDKALAAFGVAAERLPSESAILAATAWIKRRQGHWRESLDLAERAFALSPRDAALARELGNNCCAMGHYQRAVEYFDLSIALAPDQQAAYVLKAANYWSGWGDVERARAVLEEMPGGDTAFATFFWLYQEMLARDFRAALDRLSSCPFEIFESPAELVPKELIAGFLLDRTGKPEAARQACESARKLLEEEARERPGDARVHSSLGLAYAYLGRKEEAVREGERGVELYPVSNDAMHGPRQVESLATIHMLVGDHESALRELDLLLSLPSIITSQLLRIDPRWDPLRDDPGFQRLLEKYADRRRGDGRGDR